MKDLIITVDLDSCTDEDLIRQQVLKALDHGLEVSKEKWVGEVKRGVSYEFRSPFWFSPMATRLKVELKGKGR